MEKLNRLIFFKEIASKMSELLKDKAAGPDSFDRKFPKHLRKKNDTDYLRSLLEERSRENISNLFYETNITLMPKPEKDNYKKEKL